MTEYERPTPYRYSDAFLRDWQFYVENRHIFTFSGKPLASYAPPKGKEFAIEAFKQYDSEGRVIPCGQPVLFAEVVRCKSSLNLHVKMWAEDRARGTFPGVEFDNYMEEIGAPDWVSENVEEQAVKHRRKMVQNGSL